MWLRLTFPGLLGACSHNGKVLPYGEMRRKHGEQKVNDKKQKRKENDPLKECWQPSCVTIRVNCLPLGGLSWQVEEPSWIPVLWWILNTTVLQKSFPPSFRTLSWVILSKYGNKWDLVILRWSWIKHAMLNFCVVWTQIGSDEEGKKRFKSV